MASSITANISRFSGCAEFSTLMRSKNCEGTIRSASSVAKDCSSLIVLLTIVAPPTMSSLSSFKGKVKTLSLVKQNLCHRWMLEKVRSFSKTLNSDDFVGVKEDKKN
jgi:hypothetical protein